MSLKDNNSYLGLRRRRLGTDGRADVDVDPVPKSTMQSFADLGVSTVKRVEPSDRLDLIVAGVMLIASMIVRYYRIKKPEICVFDETHFGKFTNWYISGEFYFDIHPPLAKLVFAYLGPLVGYVANHKQFQRPGQHYAADETYYVLRRISAFHGSFVAPFAYLTCRALGLPLDVSLIPAFATAFDNMLVTESRLILMDSQLMFHLSLAFLLAIKMWSAQPGTWKRWGLVASVALVATFAISVKWTAGVLPLLIAVVSFFGIVIADRPLALYECIAAAGLAFWTYTLIYWIHFKSLPLTGQGDPFMSVEFRSTLEGNEYHGVLKSKGFWYHFYELNRTMYWTNKGTVQPHPYMSKWYTWPLTLKNMMYSSQHENGLNSKMILIMNPAVAIVTVVAVGVAFIMMVAGVRYRHKKLIQKHQRTVQLAGFFAIAWILNLLPYMAVERSCFLYHYLPGLYFAEILVAVLLAPIPAKPRRIVSAVICALFLIAFIIWSPWSFGTYITPKHEKALKLFDSWRI